MRRSDTPARIGGDEFVVLCDPVIRASDVTVIANHLREIMQPPFLVEGRQINMRFSIGVAIAGAQTSARELLDQADLAVAQAKIGGRNRITVYDAELKAKAEQRVKTENELGLAIGTDEIAVVYQPIARLLDGAIAGYEALVRWNHPQLGMLSPASFLTVAEDSGLIAPLGRQVLRDSLTQLLRWHSDIDANLMLHVNVGTRQLHDPAFASDVSAECAAAGVDPRFLCFEITETSLVKSLDLTTASLNAIRHLGAHIAMDAFGTEFSSLGHLHHLPVTTLKIDRSFVQDIMVPPYGRTIVEAVVNLAHGLGKMVVAEGIETIGQAEMMQDLGCDLAQGSFFSWPVPATSINAASLH